MRADTACRFANVNRFFARRVDAGALSLSGLITLVCPDDTSELDEGVDGARAILADSAVQFRAAWGMPAVFPDDALAGPERRV